MRLAPYHHHHLSLASLLTSPPFTIHTPPLSPAVSDWNSAAETMAIGRYDIASGGSQTTDGHISRRGFARLTAWRQPCVPRTIHVEGYPTLTISSRNPYARHLPERHCPFDRILR